MPMYLTLGWTLAPLAKMSQAQMALRNTSCPGLPPVATGVTAHA